MDWILAFPQTYPGTFTFIWNIVKIVLLILVR